MKKISIKDVEEVLYYDMLDNGMEIYLLPNNKVNRVYATFSTRYGGIHNEFVPIGEKKIKKVPTGIAHFLEHKVFESEDGLDPFSFYAKSGTSCNAFTSTVKTSYLFSADRNMKENVNYLLDFVQSPYFTDQNVEKEKGIIEQEIKMYEDDPSWVLYETLMKNLFQEDPHRYSIVGTVEDIRSITKEDLYRCYHTFYHPSNMFMVITGNIDPEEIIEVIKENQAKKTYQKEQKIKIKSYNEPAEVAQKYEEVTLPVEIPKLAYALKISKKDLKIDDKLKLHHYLGIYLIALFGVTSMFDEKMKEKGYITDSVEMEVIEAQDYYVLMLISDTNYPKELETEIDQTFKHASIGEEEIERFKKVIISGEIGSYDLIIAKNENIMDSIITYGKYNSDMIRVIKSLNQKEMDELSNHISSKYKSVVIVKKQA